MDAERIDACGMVRRRQAIRSDVGTVAFGGAMTMAGLLLASGAKGKRAVLPNTKMMLHMPSGVARGQVRA